MLVRTIFLLFVFAFASCHGQIVLEGVNGKSFHINVSVDETSGEDVLLFNGMNLLGKLDEAFSLIRELQDELTVVKTDVVQLNQTQEVALILDNTAICDFFNYTNVESSLTLSLPSASMILVSQQLPDWPDARIEDGVVFSGERSTESTDSTFNVSTTWLDVESLLRYRTEPCELLYDDPRLGTAYHVVFNTSADGDESFSHTIDKSFTYVDVYAIGGGGGGGYQENNGGAGAVVVAKLLTDALPTKVTIVVGDRGGKNDVGDTLSTYRINGFGGHPYGSTGLYTIGGGGGLSGIFNWSSDPLTATDNDKAILVAGGGGGGSGYNEGGSGCEDTFSGGGLTMQGYVGVGVFDSGGGGGYTGGLTHKRTHAVQGEAGEGGSCYINSDMTTIQNFICTSTFSDVSPRFDCLTDIYGDLLPEEIHIRAGEGGFADESTTAWYKGGIRLGQGGYVILRYNDIAPVSV